MLYVTDPLADRRTESATKLIKLLVANTGGILISQIRELLKILLWKITEAHGKKNLRYWSEDAAAAVSSEGLSAWTNGFLEHEHVYQKAKMIDLLLMQDADVDTILADAVGCAVTKEEHSRLGMFNAEYGWDRYRKAGITVRDFSVTPSVVKD